MDSMPDSRERAGVRKSSERTERDGNMVWNKELKWLAGMFLACFCTGVLAMNLCVAVYGSHMRAEYHSLLAAVFGNVSEAYPEVAEEELVSILNREGNEALGAELLGRYGILEGYAGASFAGQERQLGMLYAGMNLFLILFFSCMGILLYRYFKNRQERISGLAGYMEALNRRGYRVEVEDNADDELSGLRNELYKLTVYLKEQTEAAMTQKRMLADALADISHQLKTPLTSATVLLDNLSENMDMDWATRQRFLAEATRQLTGMSWLVTTVLKLSKLDAGMVELERAWISGKALVEDVVRRLEIAAEWRGISFSLDFPEQVSLFVDRKWTEEALLNIVKNAIEHSTDGGIVEISGEANEVYVQIAVRDHGEGMTREEQRKLFQRFYQGNSAREDSMGIGLSLAKEILEKQNGYITVDSYREGGTVFILRFLHGNA